MVYEAAPQARQCRELLTRALLHLMEKEAFADITVTQICQEAQVARQTFYRNFSSKQEIIEAYLSGLWLEFNRSYVQQAEDIAGNLAAMYAYLPLPRSLLRLLLENGLFYLVETSCQLTAAELSRSMGFPPLLEWAGSEDYRIRFIAATVNCVLLVWTEKGFRETPQQLAELTTRFFSGMGNGQTVVIK